MFWRFLFIVVISSTLSLFGKENKEDIAKISEAFGHLIAKNIDTLGVEIDLDCVVKGLQDAAKGKNSPMSETECIQAISAAQEATYQKQSIENLKKAEDFLKKNAQNKDVVIIEKGKLQYKIQKEGTGTQVKATDNPVIRYVGKYADGSVFGKSKEDEVICLEDTIPGFSKGLVGMKEGEKRILYIHPDYGYGTQGFLPPNSLLTFEIEIVKAHSPKEEITESPSGELKKESRILSDLDSSSRR